MTVPDEPVGIVVVGRSVVVVVEAVGGTARVVLVVGADVVGVVGGRVVVVVGGRVVGRRVVGRRVVVVRLVVTVALVVVVRLAFVEREPAVDVVVDESVLRFDRAGTLVTTLEGALDVAALSSPVLGVEPAVGLVFR